VPSKTTITKESADQRRLPDLLADHGTVKSVVTSRTQRRPPGRGNTTLRAVIGDILLDEVSRESRSTSLR